MVFPREKTPQTQSEYYKDNNQKNRHDFSLFTKEKITVPSKKKVINTNGPTTSQGIPNVFVVMIFLSQIRNFFQSNCQTIDSKLLPLSIFYQPFIWIYLSAHLDFDSIQIILHVTEFFSNQFFQKFFDFRCHSYLSIKT